MLFFFFLITYPIPLCNGIVQIFTLLNKLLQPEMGYLFKCQMQIFCSASGFLQSRIQFLNSHCIEILVLVSLIINVAQEHLLQGCYMGV